MKCSFGKRYVLLFGNYRGAGFNYYVFKPVVSVGVGTCVRGRISGCTANGARGVCGRKCTVISSEYNNSKK